MKRLLLLISFAAFITSLLVGCGGGSPPEPALTPTFEAPIPTADGFTVQITNYDATYTYAGTSTASGTASISSSGLVTVSGVASSTGSTATITTEKSNTLKGSAQVTATSLAQALTPSFGAVTPTADGFTVQITNYDPTFIWEVTSTNAAGVAIDNNSSLVMVTGLSSGDSSTVTINTLRPGWSDGSAQVTGTSIGAALTPSFGAVTPTTDGFTVEITNFNFDYSWSATTEAGSVYVGNDGLVTVSGLPPDTSTTVTINTTRSNMQGGSAQVTGTSMQFLPPP